MFDVVHLVTDLVAVTLLVVLSFVRHGRKDLLLAYVGLNLGVLAVAVALVQAPDGTAVGLGLFGALSIIRLRSLELTQDEIAYYFAALALGLVAGLQPGPAWAHPLLAAVLVGALAVLDHPRLLARDRRQVVTLDAAYPDERALAARLEELLDADVRRVVVRELDLVRDLTVVDVRYRTRA